MRPVITLAPTEQDKAISPTCGRGGRGIHILPPSLPDRGHGSQQRPKATRHLCQRKVRCHLQITKNTLKFYGKRKKNHLIIFYQFRKLFRSGCCKLWFNVVREENVRDSGVGWHCDNFFFRSFPNTEAEKWEGGKSSKRKEKRGDGKGLKMGLVVLACDKRETSTRR